MIEGYGFRRSHAPDVTYDYGGAVSWWLTSGTGLMTDSSFSPITGLRGRQGGTLCAAFSYVRARAGCNRKYQNQSAFVEGLARFTGGTRASGFQRLVSPLGMAAKQYR